MKKTLFFLLLVCAFAPLPAQASSYKLRFDNLDCTNCVDKIYDFFDKMYGKQAQNVKVDVEHHTVSFESISMDIDVVRDQLRKLVFNTDG